MLIVVGGVVSWNPRIVTDTVEIYDLSTHATQWTPATNFPRTAFNLSGVTLDNIFYVIGKT